MCVLDFFFFFFRTLAVNFVSDFFPQCNDQFLAGRVVVRHGRIFNAAIFLETINVISVKLHMVVLLIKLYQFIARQ